MTKRTSKRQRSKDKESDTFQENNRWSGDGKKLWLCAIKAARLAQLLVTMGDQGPTGGC